MTFIDSVTFICYLVYSSRKSLAPFRCLFDQFADLAKIWKWFDLQSFGVGADEFYNSYLSTQLVGIWCCLACTMMAESS